MPFILVPGAGVVSMSDVSAVHDAIVAGKYKPGDVTATTHMKTPPTASPLFKPSKDVENALRSIQINGKLLDELSPEVQRDLAAVLEGAHIVSPQRLGEIIPQSILEGGD
jgi:hypothetical protein